MKKTHKRVLGFSGLALVGALTGVAMMIPTPETLATSSVTDTIQVRVVGSVPDVNITGIDNNRVYTDSARPFNVSYENIETLVVSLEYTDLDGNVRNLVLDEIVPDYKPGEKDYNVMFVRQRGGE